MLLQEAAKARSNDALNANTTPEAERSTSAQLETEEEVVIEREDEAPQRFDRRRAAEAFERGIHGGKDGGEIAEEGKGVS